MTFSQDDIAFLVAEQAFDCSHPVGRTGPDGLIRFCATHNLASGIFDIETDIFKMALMRGGFSHIGRVLDDSTCRAVYYWDIKPFEAVNPLYQAGGRELLGRTIAVDPASGTTTITFDDLTFEAAPGTDYFAMDLWVEYNGGHTRESVLGVIYSATAKNKPILQISVIHSPNNRRFLSDGDRHTIKTPQVKI